MSELKLFLSYRTQRDLLQNEILTPIQTGRAIANEVFEEMLGDDTGDNISKENERYCELTAQYWVWKNYDKIGNPEYVGFMHNRRQFIFDSELKHLPYLWLPKTQFYFVDNIYDDYIKHFSPEKILPYLDDKPDCIAYKKVDIRPISRCHNMKEHFYLGMPCQKKEVFEILENVMNSECHLYKDTFNEFVNNHYMYCCNSFIMPKELFFEYSEFLFDVLAKVDKKVDSSRFDKKEKRFLGFIGEYLLSVFIMQKLKNPNFKLKELKGTFISKDYIQYQKKLKKYKVLSKLAFGKKRRYYIKKYVMYKMQLLCKGKEKII